MASRSLKTGAFTLIVGQLAAGEAIITSDETQRFNKIDINVK
jgi:hypothetical protein